MSRADTGTRYAHEDGDCLATFIVCSVRVSRSDLSRASAQSECAIGAAHACFRKRQMQRERSDPCHALNMRRCSRSTRCRSTPTDEGRRRCTKGFSPGADASMRCLIGRSHAFCEADHRKRDRVRLTRCWSPTSANGQVQRCPCPLTSKSASECVATVLIHNSKACWLRLLSPALLEIYAVMGEASQ